MKKILPLAFTILIISGCISTIETNSPLLLNSDEHGNLENRAQEILKNSTPEMKQKFAEAKTNDYSRMQQALITEIRKKLPIQIDENVAITDMYQDKNTLIYRYDLKGIPAEALLLDETKQALLYEAQKTYCSTDKYSAFIRSLFNTGINHKYYIENKLILSNTITPTQCHK